MPATPALLILTHAHIFQLLKTLPPATILQLIKTLTTSLQVLSDPTTSISQPQRQILQNKVANYTTLAMPCSTPTLISIKSVTLPTPPARPAPPNGAITLQDAAGRLLAVLNAEEITAFRTACVSLAMLLQRFKCGVKVDRVVVFGTGKQAGWVSRLLLRLCPEVIQVKNLVVVGRRNANKMGCFMDEFCSEGAAGVDVGWRTYSGGYDKGIEVEIGRADAIFCCTPSTQALFPVDFLTPDKVRYISMIGSYEPLMCEIHPGYLKRIGVAVVVDSVEACLVEAGEVVQAGLVAEDLVDIGNALDNFGDNYLGDVVFKCVGVAIMDLVAAEEVVKLAREQGVGTEVLGFSSDF